ncbi:MAG: hypothetical protein ACI9R8_002598, partial [Candidatus Paceibacteria bacterium]
SQNVMNCQQKLTKALLLSCTPSNHAMCRGT